MPRENTKPDTEIYDENDLIQPLDRFTVNIIHEHNFQRKAIKFIYI